jgi:predicted acetyltransferase
VQLREPCPELAASFEAMRAAFSAAGEELHEGVFPATQYWIVMDGEVVGDLELRHPLNDWLTQVGGNLGYATHPLHRNKGVAKFALREGLKILRTWGLTEALVTCRDDNAASIATIEGANGVRLADAQYNGPKRRRYRLNTLPG